MLFQVHPVLIRSNQLPDQDAVAAITRDHGDSSSTINSMIKTLEWTAEGVRFIDQTKLPSEEVYVTCRNYREVGDAIRDMVVRGAPAIGVAAAMGIAIGIQQSTAQSVPALRSELDQISQTIADTRPTAVNLFWAIRRMKDKFESVAGSSTEKIKTAMVQEAQEMN